MYVRTYRRSSRGKSLSRPGASFSILLKCRYLNCKTQREAGFSSETHFAERAHITDRHTFTIKTKRVKEQIGCLCSRASFTERALIHIKTDRTKCKWMWMWNKAVLVCREIIQQRHCRSAMKRHRKSRVREMI